MTFSSIAAMGRPGRGKSRETAAPFRPFFLSASLLAAALVPIWIAVYLGGVTDVGAMPALSWHAHEMVFGYLPAVMAGYLLSSTPNWSGRLPTSGRPLALLIGLWLAGRFLPVVLPFWPGLLVDIAFPLAVAGALARETLAKRGGPSRHGLMLFPMLAAASAAHRLFATDYDVAALTARMGVAAGVLLIAAVGGRLVPSLTRNALAQDAEPGEAARVPEPYGRYDVLVLIAAFAGLAAWVADPASLAACVLMLGSGIMQLVRLMRWRGWRLRRGDVIALHAGYAWLVLGTILAGLAADPLGLVPADVALHAFTAGAIGTMTMAVMARLALRRSAMRGLSMRLATVALAAINAGAVLRVAAPLLPEAYVELLVGGAALWSAAFVLFALAQVRELFREL